MSLPQQPDWVQAGRCDFCPRKALLHQARCACGLHTVGVHACPEKHLSFLTEGEIDCRVCGVDLPEGQQHHCALVPTGVSRLVQGSPDDTSVTCPQCGRTSRNPNDIAYRYCGNCNQFHDQMGGDWVRL